MTYDYTVSLAVLGEMGVGKSSVLLRFAKNVFKESLNSTIIDCYYSDINVRNKRVRLELWDTAGQERFKCIVGSYFRNADGVLLVYDVTDFTSFTKLTSWFLELKSENEDAVSIIVGNKIDHPKGNSVAVSSVKRFAEEQNLGFYECSAKTGENVYKIFEDLTEQVLEAKEIIPPREPLPPPNRNVDPPPTTEQVLEAKEIIPPREPLPPTNRNVGGGSTTEQVLKAKEIIPPREPLPPTNRNVDLPPTTEQVLEAKEIIPPREPLPPPNRNVYQPPTNPKLPETPDSDKKTEKPLEHQKSISSPVKKLPPKDTVVKLHKTSSPIQKKKGCCG